MDDLQYLYETVIREEEYEQDQKDDAEFLAIIKRRIVDKRRRRELILTYFGEDYDRENFGDC
jgi:hypothetical protein